MVDNYNKIKEIVAKVFGISVEDISTKSRKTKYVNARRVFAHILFDKNILRNVSEIGRLIDQNHSTILSSLDKHDDLFDTNWAYKQQYRQALNLINKQVLNCEGFDLMGLFKRIEINQKCEPCIPCRF